MAVDPITPRAPVHTGNPAQPTGSATPARGTTQYIDSFSEENPMGKAEGMQAGAPATPQAPPARVMRDLLQAVENLPLDFTALMAAMHKNMQEVRKANAQVRDSALQSQFSELMKSADELKTAANFRLAAGLIQGFVQGAMAGYQMVSSALAAKEAAQGMEPQKQAKELQGEAKALNTSAEQLEVQAMSIEKDGHVQSLDNFLADGPAPRTAAQLQSEAGSLRQQATARKAEAKEKLMEVGEINARAEGIKSSADINSKLLDGVVGQPLTAGMRFGADTHDVNSKRHEAAANQHQASFNRANDAYQQADATAKDMLKKMEVIEQARHDTNRSIIRNQG